MKGNGILREQLEVVLAQSGRARSLRVGKLCYIAGFTFCDGDLLKAH